VKWQRVLFPSAPHGNNNNEKGKTPNSLDTFFVLPFLFLALPRQKKGSSRSRTERRTSTVFFCFYSTAKKEI
jgi:hypothetical protein